MSHLEGHIDSIYKILARYGLIFPMDIDAKQIDPMRNQFCLHSQPLTNQIKCVRLISFALQDIWSILRFIQ